MLVGRRMTSPVVTISPAEQIETARQLMRERNIRHLPVVDAGRLLGIVAESDLRMGAVASRMAPVVVEDVMTTNVITVAPQTSIETAAMLMLDNKISGLPVVDGEGEVIGILTAADIINVFLDVMGIDSGAKRIEVQLPDRPGALAAALRPIGELGVNIVSVVSARAEGAYRNFVLRVATDDLEPVLNALADAGVDLLLTGESGT